MTCNWELFELRVVIYRPPVPPKVGPGDIWFEFFNVSVDLGTLGMGDFQGSNDQCNFRYVFSQLAGLKTIPFRFSEEKIRSDRLNFGNLQAAERNKLKFSAAKLYVHRRDQTDQTSLSTGVGVLLRTISVDFTVPKPNFYVQLSGDTGSVVN
jgi:hypothetical protein